MPHWAARLKVPHGPSPAVQTVYRRLLVHTHAHSS